MSLREEVLREIEDVKAKAGIRWYHWFDNFALLTAGNPTRQEVFEISELIDRKAKLDKLDKTNREFYADVDQAFRDAETYDLMTERSNLMIVARESGENIDEAESALAETYVEPFIRLLEIGYSRDDLF